MKDNPFVQFAVLIISVKAGLVALQYGASFLPTNGPIGAIRAVLTK